MKHITGHRLEFVKVEPSKSTETRQYSAFSGHDCDPSLALQPPNPRTRNDIGYLLQILGPKMKTSPEFRESCDAYCRVIAGNQAYRVIICRDGIQFIIQKAVGRDSSITGREWRGISYHRQRGGQNGKSPLCKFAGKNPPVRQVIAIMNAKASSAYGVRLQDIVVVDVDENSQDIKSLVVRRFGNSPVQVETPRGRHFYYQKADQTLPNLRAAGLPIDIKSGSNSYVAGPGSIRPDGGEYVAVVGLLGETVLLPFKDSAGKNLLASQSTERVPEGRRNHFLWRQAAEYAPLVSDVEELVVNLNYDRDNLCEAGSHRVPDAEILKIAKWAWALRTKSGGLYQGRNSQFSIHRQTMDVLLAHSNGGSEAFALHSVLVSVHGHSIGKRFTISFQGMKDSGSIAFGRNRFHAALKILLKEGLLRKSGGYAPGKNAQKYQIGSIILNKKKSLGAH